MYRSAQLRTSISPLTFVSRFYGALPIAISLDGHASVSGFDLLEGILFSIFFIVTGVLSYLARPHVNILNIILQVCVTGYPVVIAIAFLSHISRARLLSEVALNFFQLSKIYYPKNIFRILMAEVISVQVISVTEFCLYYFLHPDHYYSNIEIVNHVIHWYIVTGLLPINLQFVNVLIFIRRLFLTLNQIIKSYSGNGDKIFLLSKKPESVVSVLINYGRICRFCDIVAKTFSMSALCTATYSLLSFVLCLFNLISSRKGQVLHVDSIAALVSLVMVAVQQWVVLNACENVDKEVTLENSK